MTAQPGARPQIRLAESAEAFRSLATIVYSAENYFEIYQAICDAAVYLVSGCSRASIMLEENGKLVTGGASDDVARHIDALEREVGEGPCLDAMGGETIQLDTDLTSGPTWPTLAARILDETPVRGTAGLRIPVEGRKAAALNVFSDYPQTLDETSVDEAAVLTAFASVAIQSAGNKEKAATLRAGLDSNREIGKAVGLMMAFHKVNDQDAFEILRRSSQDMNLRVAEIAREVVRHHNDRRG